MTLVKYANIEEILEVAELPERLGYTPNQEPGDGLAKFAAAEKKPLEHDGFLYVRARAISSRVNKNNDGWPSEELAKSYKSFIGRPIFVDHNNDNPRRTRGVVVDSKLHVEDDKKSALDPYYSSAPDNHKPPTWVEILMEVDAKTFPKLAERIRKGEISATSMGANIKGSICSVCANDASTPKEYCDHIQQKGAEFEIVADNGEKVKKKAYEDCYGITFFEDSFVFDPADETADVLDKEGSTKTAEEPRNRTHQPQMNLETAPQAVDTLRDEVRCKVCESDNYQEDADGKMRCPTCGSELEPRPFDNPDLSKAQEEDEADDTTGVRFEDPNDVLHEEEAEVGSDEFIAPIEPLKSNVASGVISEMKFNLALRTESREIADKILPVKTAAAQVPITFPGGIHGGTHMAFSQAGISGTVTYQDGTSLPIPGNPMQHFMVQGKAVKEGGLSNPGELTVSLELDDPAREQEAVQIIQSGGMDAMRARRPAKSAAITDQPSRKKTVTRKATNKDEPENQKVVSDQLEPKETNVKTADEKKTVEIDGVRYELVEMKSEETEEVEAKEADRRVIKREERPDGSKTEQIVEETGDLLGDTPEDKKDEEPKAEKSESDEKEETEDDAKPWEKKKEPAFASNEGGLLARMQLADAAIEAGIVDADEKYAFVSTLENESDEAVQARADMIERVKTAGLTKTAKTAGVSRVPKLAAAVAPANGSVDIDDVPFEAIFLT